MLNTMKEIEARAEQSLEVLAMLKKSEANKRNNQRLYSNIIAITVIISFAAIALLLAQQL